MGPIGHPETSVRNYHCNITEECKSHMIGNACLGLSPHGLVPSDPVRSGPVWCFVCEFKMNSHIKVLNLRDKTWSCIGVDMILRYT